MSIEDLIGASLRAKADNAQALQAQNINANAAGVAAATSLDQARARALPLTTAADIAKTQADAAVARQQAKYIGPSALGTIGLQGAAATKDRADASATGVESAFKSLIYTNPAYRSGVTNGLFNGTPPIPSSNFGFPGASPLDPLNPGRSTPSYGGLPPRY